MTQNAYWYVERDKGSQHLGGPFKTDGDALAFLHRIQPCSWDHAIRHEGHEVVLREANETERELDRIQPYSVRP